MVAASRLPHPRQLDRVGPQRHRIAGRGEHQTGNLQRRRGLLRGRLGDRREQRHDGLRLGGHAAAANTAADAAETVADDAELGRVHADLSRAQSHPGDDVQRGAQVERQIEHRRRQPFSVSGAAATMPHDARCSSVPV